ncbi:MAG: DUF1858 domain-containing protein [archaeon]
MIKKTDNIAETIRKHPETVRVFIDFGFGCIGCAASHYETIAQGAEAHGINVEALVEALNKSIKLPKRKK